MDHVPTLYHGLWRRTLYAEPADGDPTFIDRDNTVYWLQAGDWHADLRVPADRPDFTGVASLDDCDRDQLIWLARQTAFAGLTLVEGRFCTWHRLIDLSPGIDKDIGAMRFIDGSMLEERHPGGVYREIWQRVMSSDNAQPVVRMDDARLPRWLEYGDYAMAVTPRTALAGTHDLLAEPATLDDDALRHRLEMEISFAERRGAVWRIGLSTHPWREGDTLAPD